MTRREEIQWEAGGIVNRMIHRGFSEHYDTYYQAFQDGATWADKTMIEKAWDWFYSMALDYMQGDITDVKWGSMKEDFFKAMEEEL